MEILFMRMLCEAQCQKLFARMFKLQPNFNYQDEQNATLFKVEAQLVEKKLIMTECKSISTETHE